MANWNMTQESTASNPNPNPNPDPNPNPNQEDMLALLQQPDHASLYRSLRSLSPLFRLPSAKRARVCDKTPAYGAHLAD